jgi:hypothetical protein
MKGTNSMKELKLTRKISSVLFAIVFCLFITQTAFCETEKLDIVEYTPPQGWTKTPKEGAVTYSYVNQSRIANHGFPRLPKDRCLPLKLS